MNGKILILLIKLNKSSLELQFAPAFPSTRARRNAPRSRGGAQPSPALSRRASGLQLWLGPGAPLACPAAGSGAGPGLLAAVTAAPGRDPGGASAAAGARARPCGPQAGGGACAGRSGERATS